LADLGIPKLTLDQIAELCEGAENAARTYILSQVSTSRIIDFDFTVVAKGTKPIIIDVDFSIVLSPLMKDFDVELLTQEATKQAFEHIEEYLRDLKCQ
jgi:hypothetical protein